MRVLVLGSGGREHALAWKLGQSKKISKIFIAPGNGGTDTIATNINIDIMNFEEVSMFCKFASIDTIVVGPEAPLVEGIYDFFAYNENLSHINVIGPSKFAAQLEGSKNFAKEFMKRHGIPTANAKTFNKENIEEGLGYIENQKGTIVLKCDGLAGGKGVLLIDDKEEAKEEFENILNGKFGDAGSNIIIEDFLDGIEFSVFVLTNGKNYKLLPVAKDYKRIGENDTGLNTGGMGAISPPPFVTPELMEKVTSRIIDPTIKGLQEEKLIYKGFIFFGLISVKGEPYVIEYNCRLGDPETEAIIPRIDSDLFDLLSNINNDDKFNEIELKISDYSSSTVILVSGGYPEKYEKGKLVEFGNLSEDLILFHSGTKENEGIIYTNGGRVFALTSLEKDFREGVKNSIENAEKIQYEGKYFRRDIGFDL